MGTAVVVAAVSDTPAADQAVVTHLVDGDTFDVSVAGRTERIRMLNIDTPETKDPDQDVQCLGPEAAAFLATQIPVGTTVRLEYDDERTDRYGRTLAGVFIADGTLVNAAVASAGLATAVVYGENDRFLPAVQEAQQDASDHERGLYAPDVACTLPGQVKAVLAAAAQAPPAGSLPVTSSSVELASAADDAGAAVAVTAALVDAFGGDRRGMVWSAFSRPEQDGFAARVTNARDAAQHAEIDLRRAVTTAKAREAEEARRAAEAEDARTAEQERIAAEQARIAAATQARRKAEPVAQAPASPARSATTTDAPQPAPVANPYPGYTGPRCYAPGGKTWKPC